MPTTLLSAPPNTLEVKQPEPLQGEQEEKRLKVLEHFSSSGYKISGLDEDGELSEQERFWLTDECLIRYLRASKWVLPTAIQRLEDTLRWRREFGIYNTTAEHVEPEALTGKEIIFGYDVGGRPALYMIPSRQNTTGQTRQIQYAVWMLERCIDLMEPGVGNLALLINFADRAKNPSIGTARKVLDILQSHYPERLGMSLIINVPFLIMAFLNLIFPFVDPVTRNKVKFNPQVVTDGIIAADQVMKDWGGTVEFEYKHDEYWPELVRLCETRRERWLQNWRELGGKVGIREWDFKRGEDSEKIQMKVEVTNEVEAINGVEASNGDA